ncbi:MAG: nucleoside triphosphate pyrophosphohydrolase [Ruminococcaceae bacterium]|nr:nucleoside triphosphate pyrophosphohydrolase [Oscillospiraceae bacterium]
MKSSTREEKLTYLLEKRVSEEKYTFDDLVLVMELLRSEGGCPWDIEQTHKSIRNDFIEEAYEVIEAIDTDNPVLLREELGDVLLNVVFHARIEDEKGTFDALDVTNDICVKMIHRHPHVFADVTVKDSENVLENWEKIKGEEKQRITFTDKLRAIPPMYPALLRAQKVGKKASCFDFADAESVYAKLYEEIDELRAAEQSGVKEDISEELGDLLLTVTSLARKLGVNSEEALFNATNKFISRFERLENAVAKEGGDIENMTMEELDAVWDKLKHQKA